MIHLSSFLLQLFRRYRNKVFNKTITLGKNIELSDRSLIVFNNFVILRDYVRINGNVSIGEYSDIRSFAFLDARGGTIKIGENCSINDYAIIYGMGNVIIGNNVRIAAHTIIVSGDHIYKDPNQLIRLQGVVKKPIIIEDDIWIGANSCILGGVTIGKGSIIGAGSVVRKSFPPYSVIVGNPGRIVKVRKNGS
jgi:acetyltransferase-like isoleucine patch superfamily enzyme